jgi:hypothetical protein
MELKSFKQYLNEEEQLNEFLGAILGAGRVALGVGTRVLGAGTRAVQAIPGATRLATSAGRVGVNVRGSAMRGMRQIARNPLNAAQNAAQLAMMMRGGGGSDMSYPSEPSELQSSVQLRSGSMTAPVAPVAQGTQGTSIRGGIDSGPYSWGGRNNKIVQRLMGGQGVI